MFNYTHNQIYKISDCNKKKTIIKIEKYFNDPSVYKNKKKYLKYWFL